MDIKVIEKKLIIDGKEYTFRLDFKALIKFEERYDNALALFNEFLQNKNIYKCVVKILSCSCMERDFTEDELAKNLGFSFPVMHMVDEVTFALVTGALQEEKKEDKSVNKSKKN